MRIPRVYYPGALSPGTTVALNDRAAGHLLRVLRLPAGAPVTLFNGRGGEYRAELQPSGKRACSARIISHDPAEIESPLRITLGQSVARGARMDYLLQKAVELGVTAIVPLISENSTVRLTPERQAVRFEHWKGVCASACEQCGRNRLPDLVPPRPLAAWLSRDDEPSRHALKIVLDPAGEQRLARLPRPGDEVILLSGPEGGFTPAEIAASVQNGFVRLRLGPRILRAETAPLAAITAMQTLWGDF